MNNGESKDDTVVGFGDEGKDEFEHGLGNLTCYH
jgi:hypothetical protein